jgi:hypothetical protein
MKHKWRLTIFAVVLVLAAVACTVDLGEWKFWENGGETDPAPSLGTFTPVPTLTPLSQEDLPTLTPTPTVVVPTVTPSGPSTNATGASCLPGVWQINHESVINYIQLTMLGEKEYGFTPQGSEGKLELQISPGQVNLLAEEFTVDIGVTVGEMANISAFSTSILADASANYLASDTQIALTEIVYDANGNVTSLVASFTVNFDDLLSLAQTMGFARGLPNPITSRTMNYTCSGDVLTIVVNPYASVSFDRVID